MRINFSIYQCSYQLLSSIGSNVVLKEMPMAFQLPAARYVTHHNLRFFQYIVPSHSWLLKKTVNENKGAKEHKKKSEQDDVERYKKVSFYVKYLTSVLWRTSIVVKSLFSPEVASLSRMVHTRAQHSSGGHEL